jgi:hypothetical protein
MVEARSRRAGCFLRILGAVSRIGEIAEEEVWVYLSDIPAHDIAEYGRVLAVPGAENVWFATLPATLRKRLKPLAKAVREMVS